MENKKCSKPPTSHIQHRPTYPILQLDVMFINFLSQTLIHPHISEQIAADKFYRIKGHATGTEKHWRYLPFIKGRFLRPQFQGISSHNMAWNMVLLWMVAKSCITKRMVETCWNHRNNGMFTTVFNWCRISQPSTVTYLHWLHWPSKLALRGMILTPEIPKVCALYLCVLLHEASNHKYNETQVVLVIQLFIYIYI